MGGITEESQMVENLEQLDTSSGEEDATNEEGKRCSMMQIVVYGGLGLLVVVLGLVGFHYAYHACGTNDGSGNQPGKANNIDITFYDNYNGHLVPGLEKIIQLFRKELESKEVESNKIGDETLENKGLVFLLGDSSFDNKHYFQEDKAVAPPGSLYEKIFVGENMRRDVSYQLSKHLAEQRVGSKNMWYESVNCAVEATSYGSRNFYTIADNKFIDTEEPTFSDQDLIVRDSVTKNDIVALQLGGNDYYIGPVRKMIEKIGAQRAFDPQEIFNIGKYLFADSAKRYLEKLFTKEKPRMVILGAYYRTIYQEPAFLDLAKLFKQVNPADHPSTEGPDQDYMWAYVSKVLKDLVKNDLKHLKEWKNTKFVVADFLLEANVGLEDGDISHGVEPTIQGGNKMGKYLAKIINENISVQP